MIFHFLSIFVLRKTDSDYPQVYFGIIQILDGIVQT
jgi:hypothetical protein